MGTWALSQARAIRDSGTELLVVSPTSWVPRALGQIGRANAWASCPDAYDWGGVRVEYPRWLLYHVQPLKGWAYAAPERQLRVGWRSLRPGLLATVRRFAPDVVYAHHTAVNGYLALQLNRELGLPFVVTDHFLDEIRDCAQMPARRRLFEQVAGRAHVMHATSSVMAGDLTRLFPSARVRVVHLGAEAIPDALRRVPRPSSLQGKVVVFAAAMLRPGKEMPLLVRAFAEIANKHPHAVLRIAGEGPDRAEIEGFIRERALQQRVELLGLAPRETVLQEMVWADVFALVSRKEPWGVVFTEAMAAGKPLVCGGEGGIADVVRDGEQAVIVQEGDVGSAAGALDRMLADPTLRDRLGKGSLEAFRTKLSWDAHTRTMNEIFDQARQAQFEAGRTPRIVGGAA
jgi:glycosyltransferase involved in cell wall biosynthesis